MVFVILDEFVKDVVSVEVLMDRYQVGYENLLCYYYYYFDLFLLFKIFLKSCKQIIYIKINMFFGLFIYFKCKFVVFYNYSLCFYNLGY